MRWGWVLPAIVVLGCTRAAGDGRPPVSPAESFRKPIAFSLLEDYDKGDDLTEIARDFGVMRRLGIDTWRGSFGWDDYEPEPGRYDFDWLHRFVALAADSGIVLRPYLGYTPAWAADNDSDTDGHRWNDPPASLDAWHDFVLAIATALRRHPNIASYEIYNEENVQLWWDGTASEYAAVLDRAAAALRVADPDAELLLGGMVYPDIEWVETSCGYRDNARAVDVVPIHAYPETWTPESVTVENYLDAGYRAGFLPAVAEACGPTPIWINETGFATVPGVTERDQANWWARALATFVAEPSVVHIGIYEIKDLRLDSPVIGDAPNYHLGLLRRDRTPKLAYHTVRRLLELLAADTITVADGELGVEIVEGAAGRLHQHLFRRPDGTQVLIVWDREGSPTLRIALRQPGRTVTEYALDGSAAPFARFDGRVLDRIRLQRGEVRIFAIVP